MFNNNITTYGVTINFLTWFCVSSGL